MSVSRAALVLILASTATPALADQITCHSTGNRPEPCGTVQRGSTVTLARELGGAPCIEGRTWGTGPDHDSIWVSGGCSAVFDVHPPGGGYANAEPMAPGGAAPPGRNPREWQRGYDDGLRGNADPNATSQEYLEGFRAGDDAARRGGGAAAPAPVPRGPSDNPGVFESVPNPPANPDQRYAAPGGPPPPPGYREPPPPPDAYGMRHDRHASIDQARADAQRACIGAAAQDRRYGPDRVVTRDVRWIGHGQFAVSLDTPEGPLICTVDRDGNVLSIDSR